jgi:hypothetical protein
MKKIFLLIFLLTISLGQSQALLQGFESGGINGGPFGDMPAPVIQTGTGTNTSQVLKIDGNTAGQPWQGINLFLTNPVNLTVNKTMTIDVLSSTPITFLVKVTTGGAIAAAPVTHNGDGTWQTLSFTFNTSLDAQAANPSGTYSGFVIHAYWAPGAVGFFGPTIPTPARTFYVDNISDPSSLPSATVGTFTVPAKNVGDANFTLSPPTSNNTSPFTYSSDNNSVGTIVSGNQIQVGTGGTATITASQISDGTYAATTRTATFTVNFPVPGPSPTPPARDPGSVISMYTGNPIEATYPNPVGYNMIRAPWTGGTTSDLNYPNGSNTCIKLDNFGYFGFVTDQEPVRFSVVGMAKLHVDVYLNTPLANMFVFLLSNGDQNYNTGPLNAGWNSLDIPLSSYPGANLASIYGFKFEHNQPGLRQIYLDNIYFYNGGTDPTITDFTVPAKVFGDAPFALTAPTSNSAGAFTYSSSNNSVAQVSGSTVTVTGIGTCTITANQAADGGFDAGSISAQLVVSAPPLATAAPNPPARNAWDVVSLYSDAYSNIPSAVWVGASSLTDEVLEGNPTKKMSNFIVEFINFAPTNVSEMTTLHMDIYTPDCPGFNIWLLNNGDRNAQIFPAVNGWRSLDIPLSTYVNNGLNMTALIQLKFEGLFGPGKTAYVDNVYFYRSATLPPATVGTFTVPAKNVGDANFTLTPPTSNNTSPFVYTSSNNAIATIVSGNQIQVGIGGTSTITASQVSDGTYGPTLRTATFVVSYPAPGPSPIPPVRLPSKVKSLYSAAYTTDPGYDMVRAFWTAGTTLTTVPNGTDTALRVDNLGYIGLIDVTERRLNVSTMTTLHLDVYVDTPFANLFFWLLTDGDQRRDITNLVAGWNSITINLSEFGGANLSNVYGLKFEQNQPSPLRFYLDNVYFSDDTVYADVDGDGFGDLASTAIGAQPGYVSNSTDCNDAVASINPGAVDVCLDGIDNDCNGTIDNVGLPGGCIPPVSTLNLTAGCGSTINNLAVTITASFVSGAQGYRFRVKNLATSAIQIVDRPVNSFALSNLPGITLGTAYEIDVALKLANVWQPFYGTPCSVNTPSPVCTIGAQCGTTLTSMSQFVYCNYVASVTGYRFRITNNTTSAVQVFDSGLNRFNFNQLPSRAFNTVYTVEVALKNTDGTYLPYSTGCTISSPLFPTSEVRLSQCDYTALSNTENFVATLVSGATDYRFLVYKTSIGYSFSIDRSLNTFNLNMFPGLLAGTTYSVQVAVKIGGVWGPYGKICNLTTPGAARIIAETKTVTDFKTIAFPNPFTEGFMLDVKSASENTIQVKVYDMLGKLVENRNVEANEIENLELGANYQSGIYNVIVSQDGNNQTLRVIKR